MNTLHRHLIAWTAALSTTVCAAAQIEAEPLVIDTAEGAARGWVSTIDLTDPRVDLVTLVEPGEQPTTAKLVSPEAWLADADLRIVVNANYFGAKPGGIATIVGLCVADGTAVSPPRSHEGKADPALIVDRDGRATIGHFDHDALSDARTAVAGVGGSPNSEVLGSLLVKDGVNLGATARVQPMARHPRTAVGVSEDGERLLVIVIDGRQDGWSVGVTLPELADALIERGAWDAINLDGGGSSAFFWRDGPDVRSNRPSDGAFRPVAVSLGVRVTESASASQAGGE